MVHWKLGSAVGLLITGMVKGLALVTPPKLGAGPVIGVTTRGVPCELGSLMGLFTAGKLAGMLGGFTPVWLAVGPVVGGAVPGVETIPASPIVAILPMCTFQYFFALRFKKFEKDTLYV